MSGWRGPKMRAASARLASAARSARCASARARSEGSGAALRHRRDGGDGRRVGGAQRRQSFAGGGPPPFRLRELFATGGVEAAVDLRGGLVVSGDDRFGDGVGGCDRGFAFLHAHDDARALG
ncbi:MAG: hypothetical protein V9G24_01150 [Rhodoblastus sp.]